MAKSTNPPPKQKNLFSFFSKKPSSAAKSSPSSSSTSSASASSNAKSASTSSTNADNAASKSNKNSSTPKPPKITANQLKLLSKITIGTKLAVFWPDDSEYYPCIVHEKRGSGHVYTIHYDDGEVETCDLSTEKFRVIGGKKRTSEADKGGKKSNDNDNDTTTDSGKKRRRIMEDSEDDEMEFDIDSSEDEGGDDSGSEYKGGGGDEASMDDSLELEAQEDWLAESDEEDEEDESPKKRKATKKVGKMTVTRVGVGGKSASSEITPTPRNGKSNPKQKPELSSPKDIDFSKFLSQSPKPSGNNNASNASKGDSNSKKPAAKAAARVSLSPMPTSNNNNAQQAKDSFIPKPRLGEVNPPGTHLHNHLKFFTTHRKDSNGNPIGHPDYNHHTLHVDYAELQKVSDGKKPTPAMKQWWQAKSQYADTILMFKQGKFYEMYHDDADVAAQVLGFNYMKGLWAHAGSPEAAYGNVVNKLIEAGYKVSRVEQTEDKIAFDKRKKSTPRGVKKPEVMCREVCSVLSKGTRTFCYLEDVTKLEKGDDSGVGPLVAIKETLLEESDMMVDDGEEGGTKAVCEYGVTIVDAMTGTVTLGQFADDVLRSRMQTLLANYGPSEVLYEGGQHSGASKNFIGFLRSALPPNTTLDCVQNTVRFPKSTAVEGEVRRKLDRSKENVNPWDPNEAVRELHHRAYFPRTSKSVITEDNLIGEGAEGVGRWPEILRRCIEGEAMLAISSFGAALYYLQRGLVDAEILSMRNVKAYVPPNNGIEQSPDGAATQLQEMYHEEAQRVMGIDLVEQEKQPAQPDKNGFSAAYAAEANIDHMALDGNTLSNLEILHNITSGSHQGSLFSKIDATLSPHGSRLLKAWLLRPLFIKSEIDRRADAVEELAGGNAAVAMEEARAFLKKTGDIERLLSRVSSMGRGGKSDGENGAGHHPDNRAVLYEMDKHTKRKVGDFSKLLNGLRASAEIPELFENTDIQSPMLQRMVRTTDEGGFFPAGMKEKLDWFFENFDLKKAARGEFEPSRGMDEDYDDACDAIENVKRELDAYKQQMCTEVLEPRSMARSSWKYINIKEDSKDKYLIELPIGVRVPDDFLVKAKRGKGPKQVNKYRTPEVEELVQELERAIDVKNEGKAAGMRMVFARFDSMRSMWMAATLSTSMLDALGSMAQLAVQPGYTRPLIINCPPDGKPGIEIVQGRHPCVDMTHSGGDFIPNDLVLGGKSEQADSEQGDEPGVLLLSGPNMGGKSTLLRQTCMITILAQMGCYVPAERCALSPVDRIFTRLGASDRILCGQSTFFVELAETAAAVRGATRRSLVIMDELGRGTSTFDGTAIASATVNYLVQKNKCLTLFATHYHSLLEDWKNEPSIKLGHMECIVEDDDGDDESDRKHNITFLYTLGEGPCPKSFGVNVARLAGLPDDVLHKAKAVSSLFEAEMNGNSSQHHKIIPSTAGKSVDVISNLFKGGAENVDELKRIWNCLHH